MNLFILNEFGSDTTSDWPEANKAFASAVIEDNDINPDNWWLYVIVLVGIIAGFRVLAIAALARRAAAFF